MLVPNEKTGALYALWTNNDILLYGGDIVFVVVRLVVNVTKKSQVCVLSCIMGIVYGIEAFLEDGGKFLKRGSC